MTFASQHHGDLWKGGLERVISSPGGLRSPGNVLFLDLGARSTGMCGL